MVFYSYRHKLQLFTLWHHQIVEKIKVLWLTKSFLFVSFSRMYEYFDHVLNNILKCYHVKNLNNP